MPPTSRSSRWRLRASTPRGKADQYHGDRGGRRLDNLPSECCEALFLRNVYHHVTEPVAFNKSLYTTAKPGARLAIIDAAPDKGSQLPADVPANRGGHGVPATVGIDELTAAGFVHVRTIQGWPLGDKYPTVFLVLFEKR